MKNDAPALFEVLHIDERLIAVDKAPGLPVVPTRSGRGESLVGLLRERLDTEEVYVVHRIDRGTSGVVVFARDSETHRALSMMFQERRVDKTYVALVQGRPSPPEGTIALPLRVDPRNRTRMVAASAGGKPSVTEYRTVETFRGYALVEVRPRTGRMHQIRVHLMAAGCPLAIDPVYGSSEGIFLSSFKRGYHRKKDLEERPLLARLSLHASEIAFDDAANRNARVRFSAPLPRDLSVCLKQLRKFAPLDAPCDAD